MHSRTVQYNEVSLAAILIDSPTLLYNHSKVLDLCARVNRDPKRRIRLHPSIGIHPERADIGAIDGMLDLIGKHSDSIVCVGEVGLDYSRHLIGESGGERAERAKEIQREVFARQARRAEVSVVHKQTV